MDVDRRPAHGFRMEQDGNRVVMRMPVVERFEEGRRIVWGEVVIVHVTAAYWKQPKDRDYRIMIGE